MTDRYEELRVSPDPSLAEELRQRLHTQLERSPLDDSTGSGRRLTIAPPPGGPKFEPMEEMRMSDHPTPHDHTSRWRIPSIAAAAILVVVGVGAIAVAVSNTDASDPDGVPQAPAPTAEPGPTTTVEPRQYPMTIGKQLITYTLPDGWDVPESGGGLLITSDSSTVNFWEVRNVYTDGCAHTNLDPPLGPTVDDLATVWATLPGFTATAPVDITVDGYAGKRVDYTVPDYVEADCVRDKFALWDERSAPSGPSFWAQVPEQQNRQWIVDVDGTRLVINAWSPPGTTPEQLAGLDELLASIRIG